MSPKYVLPLNDSNATIETVGCKGMSLAKLARAGLPVLDGFHLTTEAYRQFVAVNNLQERILATLKMWMLPTPPRWKVLLRQLADSSPKPASHRQIYSYCLRLLGTQQSPNYGG